MSQLYIDPYKIGYSVDDNHSIYLNESNIQINSSTSSIVKTIDMSYQEIEKNTDSYGFLYTKSSSKEISVIQDNIKIHSFEYDNSGIYSIYRLLPSETKINVYQNSKSIITLIAEVGGFIFLMYLIFCFINGIFTMGSQKTAFFDKIIKLSGKLGLKKDDAAKFDDYLKSYYEKYDFSKKFCCCKKRSENYKNNPTKSHVMENLQKKELWYDACENIMDRS